MNRERRARNSHEERQAPFPNLFESSGKEKAALPQESSPGGKIVGAPLALHIRAVGTILVGTLDPADTEPAQVVHSGLGKNWFAALEIEVLHAHHQAAASLAGSQPGYPKGARVPHVQIAGGGGRKPASVF